MRTLLRYTTRSKLKCVFYSLVIKTEALKKKYPGGISGFGKQQGGYFNKQIAVCCFMGDDVDDLYQDLEEKGLIPDEDFICFDANRFGPPREKSGPDHFEPLKFSVSWLQGYEEDDGAMVYYNE